MVPSRRPRPPQALTVRADAAPMTVRSTPRAEPHAPRIGCPRCHTSIGRARTRRSTSGSPSTRMTSAHFPTSTVRPRARRRAAAPQMMSRPGSRSSPMRRAGWRSAISRQTMSAVTPTSPVSVRSRAGAQPDRRSRSSRAPLDQVLTFALDRRQPRSVRFTSVTTSVGTSHAPDARPLRSRTRPPSHACSTLSRRPRRIAAPTRCPGRGHHPPTGSARAGDRRSAARPAQLGRTEDHRAGRQAGRRQHRRLGRDDLHDVGPALDDLSRRRRQSVRPRMPRARTPTRDRRCCPTAVPAATMRGPGVRPAAISSRSTLPGSGSTRAASRCDPGAQRERGVAAARRGCHLIGALRDDLERALGRVERVMRVCVDEPGQQRPAGPVDDPDALSTDRAGSWASTRDRSPFDRATRRIAGRGRRARRSRRTARSSTSSLQRTAPAMFRTDLRTGPRAAARAADLRPGHSRPPQVAGDTATGPPHRRAPRGTPARTGATRRFGRVHARPCRPSRPRDQRRGDRGHRGALRKNGALDEATAVLVAEMAKLQARTVGGTEDYVVTREFADLRRWSSGSTSSERASWWPRRMARSRRRNRRR